MEVSARRGGVRKILSVQAMPDGLGDADYCVVDFDQEYAELLLRRIDTLRRLRTDDPTLGEMSYTDSTTSYYAGDPAQHSDHKDAVRIDLSYVTLSDVGASWEALPEHGSERMTTSALSREDLEGIVAAVRNSTR